MTRFFAFALKAIAIFFAPIAVAGFVVSRQAISGDQYAAVIEIIGTNEKPGAIQIFGLETSALSKLIDFLDAWSLPIMLAVGVLGILGLIFSGDKLRATFHVCAGLFVSFGAWALLFTRSSQAFTEFVGSQISDLSAMVMAAFLAELSAKLLNVSGQLALMFAGLAFGFWLASRRRKAHSENPFN